MQTIDRQQTKAELDVNSADAIGALDNRKIRLRLDRLSHFGDQKDVNFFLVTNPQFADQFELSDKGEYRQRKVVVLEDGIDFQDLLDREIPEPAHILLISPGSFITSPTPEKMGRRKLIVLPCNSTPTGIEAIGHFLRVVEKSDPTREVAFADKFFDLGRESEQLEFVDDFYKTRAVFKHLDDSYEWNMQAGPVDWGEQQIAPSGELSVLPGSIMGFDPSLTLDIDGELAIKGYLAIHSGTPSFYEDDRARLYSQLATIRDHAVIAKIAGGKIVDLKASHPEAKPAVRALSSLITLDSRYATLWECGFGINSELDILEGNVGMNEPYGGSHGCSHWGLGLTPYTQYALIILCPGTRVTGKNGMRLIGPVAGEQDGAKTVKARTGMRRVKKAPAAVIHLEMPYADQNTALHAAPEYAAPAAANFGQAIVRIMEVSERPDVISFAGGFPEPRTIFVDPVQQIVDKVFRRLGHSALGYGPTPGITKLRSCLAQRLTNAGRATGPEEILVATGGIAALDLVAKTLLSPGDTVVLGRPAYVGSLQVFSSYRTKLKTITSNASGFDLDLLEVSLQEARDAGQAAKLIYVIPSFDNPTGSCMRLADRERLVRIAEAYDTTVIEDATYNDFYFTRAPDQLLASIAPDRVIYINTFSKTMCPGFRLGWIAARAELIERFAESKQHQDQCSSTLGQHVMAEALNEGLIERQLAHARPLYKSRRDRMLAALQTHMSDLLEWNEPLGGFFIWGRLKRGLNAVDLAQHALADDRIAILPGTPFYADEAEPETLRLSYSFVDEQMIGEGIERLARVAKRLLGEP